MCYTDSCSVHCDPSVMVPAVRHRNQRKLVRSVMWRGEDSCRVIVTVTNVIDDVVEHDFVVSVELNLSGKLNVERHIYRKKTK